MAKKGSTRLHFLRMLKKGGMPPEDLETVYTTLIRPVLEYANVVYVGCNTKQNNTLEAVQRRAARIIYGNSTQTTPFSTLQDRQETAAKTLLKQMRHVSHTLHSLMPCDRHQSTRRSLRNGNHISVPNRLEPKNRKDSWGHPVANLAARPSATSDNPGLSHDGFSTGAGDERARHDNETLIDGTCGYCPGAPTNPLQVDTSRPLFKSFEVNRQLQIVTFLVYRTPRRGMWVVRVVQELMTRIKEVVNMTKWVRMSVAMPEGGWQINIKRADKTRP
ncbi:hypothetical protein Bbelb_242060 [Branchiostoma belcheri]|nr:hypothetical protein Bbelb_242060 [Branchiostoma belcheri]